MISILISRMMSIFIKLYSDLFIKSYRDLCSVKMKFFIEFCIETSDLSCKYWNFFLQGCESV